MAFSFLVEILNISMVKRQKKRRVVELNEPTLKERSESDQAS
jgi:hypothetical protein